jgi:hypothetical protein
VKERPEKEEFWPLEAEGDGSSLPSRNFPDFS